MNPTVRRVAVSGSAWLVGAAAAVAVSLLALSQIHAATATGPAQPLAPDSLTRALPDASAPPSPAGTDGAGSAPASPPPAAAPRRSDPADDGVQRLLTSDGGTVVARCTGGSAYLLSWSPAQGYRATRVERGPAARVSVTFRGGTDHTAVEAEIRCVAGAPTLEDDRHDDHDGD